MATILVTGFEPYGGLDFNPTEHIVNTLSASGGADLVTALLPTSYRRAETELVDLLSRHRPAAVLMLGLNQYSSRLCFEQVASNLDNSLAPDNEGDIRVRKCIVDTAPRSYPNTLRFELMESIATDAGEPVDYSNDAGGYVCNHVFFIAAHHIATELEDCRYGFVHIPLVAAHSARLTIFAVLVRDWIEQLLNEA